MKFKETSINGVFIIELEPVSDDRGWFARTFCKQDFSEIGFQEEFVQINQSFNLQVGTFRGLHYQVPPKTEIKLIQCVSGSVLDIATDIRRGSPTFLKSSIVEMSAGGPNQKLILIPAGVAHGFVTLQDNSSLIYHHTEYYSKEHDRGLRIDDPVLNIRLPVPIQVISKKDQSYELLPPDFQGVKT